MPAAPTEGLDQREGAHTWMVVIGGFCLALAITVGVLGRVAGSTVTKVGDKTTTKAWPSETLITSLLAVGAVIVITGFLWSRITTIKVAGAEIDLLNKQEKEKTAEQVVAAMPDATDAKKVASATAEAVQQLGRRKAQIGSLSAEDISKVVQGVASDAEA